MAFYMNCGLDEAIGHYLDDEERSEQEAEKCDICGCTLDEYYYLLDGEKHCEECAEEWLHEQRRYLEED